MRFVLASASPARLATLRAAGVEPEVIVSDVDESLVTAGSVAARARELARRKASAVAARLDHAALVLGCDSLLELDGEALGKPTNAEAAAARWRRMRGRTGVLYTGHCLLLGDRAASATPGTTVTFADVTDDEVAAYVATGEPLHVAGAFTVDGLGGWFVEAVDGDLHNVVGLSLPTLRRLLRELGLTLADLGYPARVPPNARDAGQDDAGSAVR